MTRAREFVGRFGPAKIGRHDRRERLPPLRGAAAGGAATLRMRDGSARSSGASRPTSRAGGRIWPDRSARTSAWWSLEE